MENVTGILTMRNGEVIKEIIAIFSEVGYQVNIPFQLKSECFGVPQKRRRVFIIGSLRKITINQPRPLFSEIDETLPLPTTVKNAIFGLPALTTGQGFFEIESDYTPTSPYEQLMMNIIDFKEFYYLAKSNNLYSNRKSLDTKYYPLFSNH
jgi:DNA (cytosine-5)-methyltransferase 1